MSTGSDATGTYNRYEYDYGTRCPIIRNMPSGPMPITAAPISTDARRNPAPMIATSMLTGQTGGSDLLHAQQRGQSSAFRPRRCDAAAERSAKPLSATWQHDQSAAGIRFPRGFCASEKVHFYRPEQHYGADIRRGLRRFRLQLYSAAHLAGSSSKSLADRLMFRLAYRNFGDHEALVVAHNVAPGGGSSAISAMRWYELRATPVGGSFCAVSVGNLPEQSRQPLDGQRRHGQGGQHCARHERIERRERSQCMVHWTARQRSSRENGSAHHRRKGNADRNRRQPALGRLQQHEHRPERRLHLLVQPDVLQQEAWRQASVDWDTRILAFKFDNCK